MNTCHQPMADRFDHLRGKKNAGLVIKTIAWPVDLSTLVGKKDKIVNVHFGPCTHSVCKTLWITASTKLHI